MKFNYRVKGWLVACCTLIISHVYGQNINGFKITVGKDAPAFLIFNDDVKSFEFNSTEAYKYYDIIKRSGNAISITYKRESGIEPSIQNALVSEGKRTHSFQIFYDAKYDINKNKQLLFDYSDLKALKKAIATAAASESEQAAIAKAEQEAERKAAAAAKREQELATERRMKEAQ